MSSIAELFEQNIVQNFSQLFSQSDALEHQFPQNLLQSSKETLASIINEFFNQPNAIETALALDMHFDEIQALKNSSHIDENHVNTIAKIAAYLLAKETNTFTQVEVFDTLKDYPM